MTEAALRCSGELGPKLGPAAADEQIAAGRRMDWVSISILAMGKPTLASTALDAVHLQARTSGRKSWHLK